MPKAHAQYIPSAPDLAGLHPPPDASAVELIRAADALDVLTNDLVPYGRGGAFDALLAAERAIEARILALPAGNAQRLAWNLARLAAVLADDDATGWQVQVARSCLADARAIAAAGAPDRAA